MDRVREENLERIRVALRHPQFLEEATFGVLEHNRLARTAKLCCHEQNGDLLYTWWAFPDLNWGPADYESDALTN